MGGIYYASLGVYYGKIRLIRKEEKFRPFE